MYSTINLLPKERSNAARKAFITSTVLQGVLVLLAACIATTGLLQYTNIFLARHLTELRGGNGVEADLAITKEITAMNAYVALVEKYYAGQHPPSLLLKDIAQALPAPARLTTFSLEKNEGVRIVGHAATRADVIAIEQALKKIPALKNVTSPLENLLKPRDITFEFTADLATAI